MAEAKTTRTDKYGVPWIIPADFDVSEWPQTMPFLRRTMRKTKGYLWNFSRTEYQDYLDRLDALVKHCGTHPNAPQNIQRRAYHHLLLRHYDMVFPEEEKAEELGPVCDAEHMAALTEAAEAVEAEPDLRASAIWASEKATLVLGLGWERVCSEDVIGLTALGLLEEAVRDRPKFYKEVLLQYAVKTKDRAGTKFSDDGQEQIDYAQKLTERAKGVER